MRISKTFTFEAAHHLPNVPAGHQCGRVHGHTYRVEVVLEGDIDPRMGWVVDYGRVSDAWRSTGGLLDHTNLNDHMYNPTAELLADDLLHWMHAAISEVVAVTVHETATSSATATL
jgi:6-pyruvoyltetrahydropterin/6-carboxytetrahydropterin synthase